MRFAIALAVVVGGAAMTGQAAAAAAPASVEIKDAVVQVTIVPEDRSDIRVDFLSHNPHLPLRVRPGRRTIIDGDLKPSRIRGCKGQNGDIAVRIADLGDVPMRAIPRLVIHAPRDVEVTAGGAVFGAIGRASSVTLGNAGCGDWTIANVDKDLKISLAGSGDARAGAAGTAKLRVTGSGDVATAAVRGRVDVDVAGAGNVSVLSVAGPLDVHVAGAGDVTVYGGRATTMSVGIAGSGNVTFNGVAGSLDARIAGSGDVRARQVQGSVRKSVMGSGTVTVD
jgi:hypothetical protein